MGNHHFQWVCKSTINGNFQQLFVCLPEGTSSSTLPGRPPNFGSPYFVPPRRHERKNPGGRGGRHFVGSGFAGLQRSTPPVFIEIERKPMEFPNTSTPPSMSIYLQSVALLCPGVWVLADPETNQWAGNILWILSDENDDPHLFDTVSWILSQWIPHSLHLQRTFFWSSRALRNHMAGVSNKSMIETSTSAAFAPLGTEYIISIHQYIHIRNVQNHQWNKKCSSDYREA